MDMYCNCGEKMRRIHFVTLEGKTVCIGFYCPPCEIFEKAIGRERKLPIVSVVELVY